MCQDRLYLNCPFDEKDECKSLGARWDGDARKWYITADMGSEPFARWMNEGEGSDDGDSASAKTA